MEATDLITNSSRNSRQQSAFQSIKTSQGGSAGLLAIFAFTALIFLFMFAVGISATTNLETGLNAKQGLYASLMAETCAREAMLGVYRNPDYTGGSFAVGEGYCTMQVIGAPCAGTCTIRAQATIDNYTEEIEITANMSGDIGMLTWQEL